MKQNGEEKKKEKKSNLPVVVDPLFFVLARDPGDLSAGISPFKTISLSPSASWRTQDVRPKNKQSGTQWNLRKKKREMKSKQPATNDGESRHVKEIPTIPSAILTFG